MYKYRILYDALRGYYIQKKVYYFFKLISCRESEGHYLPYGNIKHIDYYRTIARAKEIIDRDIEYYKKENTPDKIIEYYP